MRCAAEPLKGLLAFKCARHRRRAKSVPLGLGRHEGASWHLINSCRFTLSRATISRLSPHSQPFAPRQRLLSLQGRLAARNSDARRAAPVSRVDRLIARELCEINSFIASIYI